MDGLGSADILLFEGFRLDRRGGVLYRLDQAVAAPVVLGSRALSLLGLLAARQGEVLSKDAIMTSVWPGRVVEEANLNVQISKLRHILDHDRTEGSCIQTLPGRGYSFIAPVTQPDPNAPPSPSGIPQGGVLPRPRLSLVVLPFENLGDDREQQHFADGITDDLTTDLSRHGDLFVISRTTAFTYRSKPIDIKQIGHELGVRYALEGSVRRSGNQVRLNVQLIDAEADAHLWVERFDRQISDLFELQDEITTAIVGAIEPELLKSERNRIARPRQWSEGAYELYQRGMFHHYRQNKADNIEAQAYFRQALAIEVQYPEATAALSIALTIAAYLSWAEDAERNFEEAFELAQRAVALDARYPNAHFALALICMWTARSDRAMGEFQEAIKLNPSFAAAHAVLGVVLNSRGQPEDAVASVERGIRLSPSDPRMFIWLSGLAAAHYQLQHYSQGVEIGRRSWTLNRNYITGLTYVVAGLAQLGQIEEARTALIALKELDPKLAAARTIMQRVYQNQAGIAHLLEGLRKAGFE
jgi:TolB-like protein/DNA-binding winged helix-turn-helix (wHTH) protein